MDELMICGYIRQQCNRVQFEWIMPTNIMLICVNMYHISYAKLKKLCGDKLIRRNGDMATFQRHISGSDLVAFYFSGKWCPPSKVFTAKLKTFYDECISDGYKLQIIFVSSDRTPMEMMEYFRNHHGDYLGVEHNSDHAKYLQKYFNMQYIPTLCIVNDQAQIIDSDGRGTVENKGKNAIKQWLKISKSILK